MNDIYLSANNELINFRVDDVGSNTIERAKKLLAGIPGGVKKAVGSALKRASSSGEAYAARAVRKEYLVKASDYKEYTTSKIRHIVTDASGATEISIQFHGYHIPLIRFDTSFGKDGKIAVRVKRGSAKQTLENAFIVKKDRLGIYERIGDDRFPIRQFWGPATTQMMDSNDDVSEDIANHIRETFDKRIEHEITRVLNGWGG